MADTSALEQKAVEIITNLEKLAEPAMQLTLRSLQVSAVIDLITAGVGLAVLVSVWLHYTPLVFKWFKGLDNYSDASIPAGLSCAIAAIGSVIVAGICLMSLLNTSNWLAVFAPELALARLLLNKVI